MNQHDNWGSKRWQVVMRVNLDYGFHQECSLTSNPMLRRVYCSKITSTLR